MEYIPTNIRLTVKQHERLRKESFDTKKSQAEIVREALEMRWAQKEKEEKKMKTWGDWGAATSTGDWSAATSTGDHRRPEHGTPVHIEDGETIGEESETTRD